MITTTRDNRNDNIPINTTNNNISNNNYLIELTNRLITRRQYRQYRQQFHDNNNELDNEYRINIRHNDGYGRTQSEHRYHHRDNDENSRTSLERIITIVKLMELVIIIVFFAYLGIQS